MVAPGFLLANTDAVEWLRSLPSGSVDLLITDPPYESLEKHRAIGTTTRLKHSKASSNDWFQIFPNERFEELFVEVHRVLRPNTHFYLYCDQETMFVAKPIAEQVGFRFWKPLIWDKCLGPDTLVWSTRGVVRIADLQVGDHVAIPEGGTSRVRGVRRTRAEARRLHLSDGTELIASLDHKLVLADGRQVEAGRLNTGQVLAMRPIKTDVEVRGEAHDPRPSPACNGLRITKIAEVGVQDLVDISIEHPSELFLLANGLVSHNCKIGMGYHYRARYECILFFEKGKRKLNDLGIPDILAVPRVHRGYPAEKPSAVSEILINQSSEPGQLVVDPFMGSGSVGGAAITLGRDFAGNDLCAEAVDISGDRLVAAGGRRRDLFGERGSGAAVGQQLGLGLS